MGLNLQLSRRGIGRQRLAAVTGGPFFHRHQHLAGLAPLVLADDAVFGHEIDQPGPAAVADAEGPLQERDAAAALADDHLDGRLVELVLVLAAAGRLGVGLTAGGLEIDQFRGILRLAGADGAHHAADLVVADERSLAAEDLAGAWREEEHVAVAEEPLGPHLVEDDPAVGPAGDLEGDPGRQVALDQAGDHVDGRLLGRQNEVDADRPALLGEPDDVGLDLLAGGHHHVGDLVGDHHDEGHRRRDRGRFVLGLGLDPTEDLVAAEGVVLGQVADARLRQEGVPLLHLLDRPGEDRLGLSHVGDDRVHQVGERLVGCQLDHLGVDHQHPDLVGPAGHQHRDDDRVQADRLAGAGPAGDQEMGHRRHVHHHRIAGDVLAEEDRDLHRAALRLGLLDHLAEADHLAGRVGHLDADRVLAGNRGDDPDARDAESDRQIVGEVGDLGQPEAGLELDLVLRDDRAGLDLDHLHLEAELREGLLEHPGPLADLLLLLVELEVFRGEEQVEARQLVVAGRLGGEFEVGGGRPAAGAAGANRHGRSLGGLLVFGPAVIGLRFGVVLPLAVPVGFLVGHRDGGFTAANPNRRPGVVVPVIGVGFGFAIGVGIGQPPREPVPQAGKHPGKIEFIVGISSFHSRPQPQPAGNSCQAGRRGRRCRRGKGCQPDEDRVEGQVKAAPEERGQKNGGPGIGQVGRRQEMAHAADASARAPKGSRHRVGQKQGQERAGRGDRHRGGGRPEREIVEGATA